MPVAETVLIYVVIPLAIVLVLAALTLPGGRRRPRWKSGQPWEHDAVWYEPHPEALGGAAAHGGGHGEHGDGHAALGGGHGATALTAGAEGEHEPVSGGPLGGARGTW